MSGQRQAEHGQSQGRGCGPRGAQRRAIGDEGRRRVAKYTGGAKAGEGERDATWAEAGDLLFGNMDTWVVWNMTGGTENGIHITDPTNASRTLLMAWSGEGFKLSNLPI